MNNEKAEYFYKEVIYIYIFIYINIYIIYIYINKYDLDNSPYCEKEYS